MCVMVQYFCSIYRNCLLCCRDEIHHAPRGHVNVSRHANAWPMGISGELQVHDMVKWVLIYLKLTLKYMKIVEQQLGESNIISCHRNMMLTVMQI